MHACGSRIASSNCAWLRNYVWREHACGERPNLGMHSKSHMVQAAEVLTVV